MLTENAIHQKNHRMSPINTTGWPWPNTLTSRRRMGSLALKMKQRTEALTLPNSPIEPSWSYSIHERSLVELGERIPSVMRSRNSSRSFQKQKTFGWLRQVGGRRPSSGPATAEPPADSGLT